MSNMRLVLKRVVRVLVVVSSIASAADSKSTGQELINRARNLSEIRFDGAPAFRLEGTFETRSKDGGEKSEGTLSEIWMSNRQWRREVQSPDFHRIEIRRDAAKWLSNSGSNPPEPAVYGLLTLVFAGRASDLKVTNVSERQLNSRTTTCVEAGLGWTKSTDCIDPETGSFVQREVSFDAFTGGSNAVRHSCFYSQYEKFGDRIFPRFVRCANDPGVDIELTITKLVPDPSVDPSRFERPLGASEEFVCEKKTPPKAVSTPAPEYPGHSKGNAVVTVSTVVGIGGIPNDLQIVKGAGPDFDRAALNSARRWKFQPSTCDGTPIPMRINIEISFR